MEKNKETINNLYQTFYSEIYDYVLKKVGDETIAEDITEDVFIQLFMMSDIVENPEHFMKSAKWIADYECVPYIKVKKSLLKSWKKRIRKVSMIISVGIALLTLVLRFIVVPENGGANLLYSLKKNRMIRAYNLQEVKEEDFDGHALSLMHLPGGYGCQDILDIGVDEEYYRKYIGIESVGHVVDGTVICQNPDVAVYALWIELTDEKYAEQIISEVKSNLKPEQWELTKIEGVSVEEFMYCTDGEFVFVCYFPDEEVNDVYTRDMEDLEKMFHKLVEIKRICYN